MENEYQRRQRLYDVQTSGKRVERERLLHCRDGLRSLVHQFKKNAL